MNKKNCEFLQKILEKCLTNVKKYDTNKLQNISSKFLEDL